MGAFQRKTWTSPRGRADQPWKGGSAEVPAGLSSAFLHCSGKELKEEVMRLPKALKLKTTRQNVQGLRLSPRTHCDLVPDNAWTHVAALSLCWQKSFAIMSMTGTLKLYAFSLLWLVTLNSQWKALVLPSRLENWTRNQKNTDPKTVHWPLLEKHTLESVTSDSCVSYVFIVSPQQSELLLI